MGLVVRCPECRGIAGIDPTALGQTVRCPRCDAAFMAVPEAELVAASRPNRNPTLPSRPTQPDEPESPQLPPPDEVSPAPESDHDPHRHPPGGLPATVLIGLALLPFAIPILWLTAPAVFGQPPLLSIAVPLSIAVSASILSLAVIYTIDWSPSVRVKGVLMLLGLAYFVAVSLYFLKKEMVEWVKTNFETWITFTPTNQPGDYSVKLPIPPTHDAKYQPIPEIQMDCYTLTHQDVMDKFKTFAIGAGTPRGGANVPNLGKDPWFKSTIESIIDESKGQLDPAQQTKELTGPKPKDGGREFGIKLADDKTIRIVRIFVISNRVYYLSIEGAGLSRDDVITRKFFDSFHVPGMK
jgi:hypothetical protein